MKKDMLSEFLGEFLEKHQDEDIDFKLMYLGHELTKKITDTVNITDTQELKEKKVELFQKIDELLGGIE